MGSDDFFDAFDLADFVVLGSEGAGEEEDGLWVCWPFVALPERRGSSGRLLACGYRAYTQAFPPRVMYTRVAHYVWVYGGFSLPAMLSWYGGRRAGYWTYGRFGR